VGGGERLVGQGKEGKERGSEEKSLNLYSLCEPPYDCLVCAGFAVASRSLHTNSARSAQPAGIALRKKWVSVSKLTTSLSGKV